MAEFSSYSQQSLKVRDYKKFIDNPDYRQILDYSVFFFDWIVNYQNVLIREIQNLHIQIDKEVAHYEKK
jgi:hypothetical protein